MNKINPLNLLNQKIAEQSIQPISGQYLSTGIAALDRCIGGMPVGRTTLVMGHDDIDMIEYLVSVSVKQLRQGQFVVLFQKDPQQAALMLWCIVAQLTNISVTKLRYGQLTDQEIALITPVFTELNQSLAIYFPEENSANEDSEPVGLGGDHDNNPNEGESIKSSNNHHGFSNLNMGLLDRLLDVGSDDIDEFDDYMNASLLTECLMAHQMRLHDRSMFVVLTLNAMNDIAQIKIYQQVINRLQGNKNNPATFLIMTDRRRFSNRNSLHDIAQSSELYQLSSLVMELSTSNDSELLKTDLINVIKSSTGSHPNIHIHLDRVMT
jgi:hypothetical protein